MANVMTALIKHRPSVTYLKHMSRRNAVVVKATFGPRLHNDPALFPAESIGRFGPGETISLAENYSVIVHTPAAVIPLNDLRSALYLR